MAQDVLQQSLVLIPRLRRYARLLTGQAAWADDLVQDTLERALRKQHLWQAPAHDTHAGARPDLEQEALKSWLLQVMHNLFLNQLRVQQPGALSELDDVWEPSYQPHHGLEMRLDLERALALLPAVAREVLLLVCVEEMSYEQAAAVLQVPVGTVMSRLSRARQRMQQLLEPSAGRTDADKSVPHLRVLK